MGKSTTPLSDLKAGDRARIMALRGGREFQHRVVSMGLSMGCEIEVMQSGEQNESGPVVVRAGATRLMLGHGMSDKVIVRRIGD